MSVCLFILLTIFLLSFSFPFLPLPKEFDWKILLTIIGGLLSLVYFVQKQQIEEMQQVKDLLITFNERYDKLNEKLNTIIKSQENYLLNQEEINKVYDYFNLCAEEFLFYRKGYIYPEVWENWLRGMKIFFSNKQIRNEWEKEKGTNSYYGFDVFSEFAKHKIS
jgi:hypothetical protein